MRYCPACATPLTLSLQGHVTRPTCPVCGFVAFADPKVVVAIIIRSNDGVLLGRRGNEPGRGRWALPAGYVDRGEVLEAAAAREAQEELNVDVRIERLVGLYSNAGDPVILAVYAATIIAGEPQAGDDLEAIGYFRIEALPDLAFARDADIVRAGGSGSDQQQVPTAIMLSADRKELDGMTAREELRLLADSLPEPVVEELAAIGRLLDHQTRHGEVEEVTVPEEVAIVREALIDEGTEAEYTPEQAKEDLAARRRRRGA